MSRKAIRSECIFTGFSSKVDGSLSFRGTTPELSTEEKITLMDLQGVLCEMLVFPKEEKEGAEVLEVKKEMDFKPASQRMRAVIFLIWKHEHQDTPFEVFYGQTMERLIEWLKRRLPDQ